MKKILFLSFFLLIPSFAGAGIKVITSSQDLKSITEFIGGNEVSVEALASGDQDLHAVEPRPSMVFKLKKADMAVRLGLDLDMWMDSLINAAKNKNLFYGAPGYVDASAGMPLLQKPEGKVDGSMGDIHIFGNPHYWLDPENGKVIANNVREGLTRLLPGKKELFQENYEKFCAETDRKMAGWKEKLSSIGNRKIITYHNSWVYFAKRFGLEITMNIEPKPGIPPNANQISSLLKMIKEEKIKVLLVDNFYPLKAPEKIAADTGAETVVVPSSVNGEKEAYDYFALFDVIIRKITGKK